MFRETIVAILFSGTTIAQEHDRRLSPLWHSRQ
jgi:hypothetical protein